MRKTNEILRHGAIGFVLALGAPGGWLLWRTALTTVDAELMANGALYLYLFVGSVLAFVTFGATMGFRVQRLAHLAESLRAATVVDSLTKLKNRRYFTERLSQELARTDREGNSVVLLVGDLDRFKAINDVHGHVVGDLVLRAVADALTTCCRTADSACRIGGEEFALILPNTNLSEGARVAERVRVAISRTRVPVPGGEVRPTISLGLAMSSDSAADVESLFAAADKALYRAKVAGRDRVELDEHIEPSRVAAVWAEVRSADV